MGAGPVLPPAEYHTLRAAGPLAAATTGARNQGDRMPTLQQQIADKFLKQLAESTEVSAEKIDKIRAALAAAKKPKADDFVRIFNEPDHAGIK
jgi:hypothetical protein